MLSHTEKHIHSKCKQYPYYFKCVDLTLYYFIDLYWAICSFCTYVEQYRLPSFILFWHFDSSLQHFSAQKIVCRFFYHQASVNRNSWSWLLLRCLMHFLMWNDSEENLKNMIMRTSRLTVKLRISFWVESRLCRAFGQLWICFEIEELRSTCCSTDTLWSSAQFYHDGLQREVHSLDFVPMCNFIPWKQNLQFIKLCKKIRQLK